MHTFTDACTHFTYVLDQVRGDWDTHGVHICTQLCKGGEADVTSQMNKQTFTYVCTHSNQGIEPDEELMGHAYGPTQVGHICAQLCKGGGPMCSVR